MAYCISQYSVLTLGDLEKSIYDINNIERFYKKCIIINYIHDIIIYSSPPLGWHVQERDCDIENSSPKSIELKDNRKYIAIC